MTHKRKPCVNCTCATTGFCPRGVGANIPPELAAARPAPDPVGTPPCFLMAAHRPDLRTAVSEKRRGEAAAMTAASQTEAT